MKLKLSALLAAAITSLAIVAPAQAYQRKHIPRSASGIAILKASAQSKAVSGWSSNVKSSLGLSWSVWNIAAAKNISCSRTGAKWTCKAKAKPCNYVVP